MPEDMGVPREQEKDFDASLSGGGTAADFWANRCDQLKEEIKTLRSDLSKREAEVAAWGGAAKKTFDMMDQIGQTDLCAFYEVNRDTASVAKAHDDKVAREIWKEAKKICMEHARVEEKESKVVEAQPDSEFMDKRAKGEIIASHGHIGMECLLLANRFGAKAESGGK